MDAKDDERAQRGRHRGARTVFARSFRPRIACGERAARMLSLRPAWHMLFGA
jgi:hypothetical protein